MKGWTDGRKYGRSWRHGDKTKFSRIDGLPYFLNNGDSRARAFGARGAPIQFMRWWRDIARVRLKFRIFCLAFLSCFDLILTPLPFCYYKKQIDVSFSCVYPVIDHEFRYNPLQGLGLGRRRLNRPFPSSCLPPLQSESKCEVFVMVISSTLNMKTNFHEKSFAPRLALKRRQTWTRKWPISD